MLNFSEKILLDYGNIAGTANSGAPEFTPLFSGVRVTRSLAVCVCFVDRCLSLCTFSFGHCGFWLPLWCLQTLLVVAFTVTERGPNVLWYSIGLQINIGPFVKWIKWFFFFSENLDLIEYELYEWTGERYRLKWASSFSLRWICMHFYSFNSFEKFLSRIHNIFLLLLPFPRYEGQKITMTIIFIFCISGLILMGFLFL
jgi:hypothetical protein